MIMAGTVHAGNEVRDEIREMVKKREFLREKDEFSPVIRALVDRGGKTGEGALEMVTAKIVEFLPDYLTGGLIHCSLAMIGEQDVCKRAVSEQKRELTIRPGDGFPTIPFQTFYPYLEFILRAGPIDILKMKNRFKVEGNISLKDAKILFLGDQVRKISGTIMVSAKISLCKGKYAALVHQFEKPIQIE
jgi:hypothetical protein